MRNKLPPQFATELRKQLLQAAADQPGLGFASTSLNKFKEVQSWLADQLDLATDDVAVYWAGGQKNVPGRARQARDAADKRKRPFAINLVVSSHSESAATFAAEGKFAAPIILICQAPPQPTKIAEIALVHVVAAERDARPFIDAIPKVSHRELYQTVTPESDSELELKIEPRVKRMAKISISSTSAVILVGPPGTGKSTLLGQIIAEIRRDPGAFGFTRAPKEPKWITAEESWTTRDLVGGETVDESQRLRFALGHVLDAIREDRWLVVDEMNRADMDKIFGALMTWLAQTDDEAVVDIGRASTDPNAAPIQLGWVAEVSCFTDDLSRLTAKEIGGEPIRFMAGTEWRMLGTYNAVDAHRVFRFGQALGRRFVRVPIPAPPPALFEAILTERNISEKIAKPLVALYAAHYAEVATRLGPAVFLHALDYINADAASGAPLAEILAEGYLVTAGAWLASLDDDDLDQLGARIRSSDALPAKEWDWICSMIPSLR